jgi:Abnormal spindle-like microcephaly-assoc'd, ASPM-SPD-2-Hydin
VSGTGFSMAGLAAPVTVAAGASTSFTVTFQPAAAGAATGNITIASNASNSPSLSIPLSGTGVATILTLSPSPSSVAFGSVTVATTATQNVQLTNTGNAAVDITTVSTTGTGFSVSGGSNTILNPNQSVTVSVSFTPQTAAQLSGNLSVSSNAPALNVPLSGTGVAAPSHSVSLAWDASPSNDVVSYNLYRSSSPTGPFTKVGSTTSTVLAFTDTTVKGGQTYFYEVTSVDSTNLESAVEGPVQVAVPSP